VFAVWVLHQSLYERIPGPRASHHWWVDPGIAMLAGRGQLLAVTLIAGSTLRLVATGFHSCPERMHQEPCHHTGRIAY